MARITKLFVFLAIAVFSAGCASTQHQQGPMPPQVLHNGRWVPMQGAHHAVIPHTAQIGIPFQTVYQGKRTTMVCSPMDRLASGGLGTIIGGLIGHGVGKLAKSNRTGDLTIAGAVLGGAYGLSDFGCKPELIDDGDRPQQQVAVGVQQQGERVTLQHGTIPASRQVSAGEKDIWKWRHRDATNASPKLCIVEDVKLVTKPQFCSELRELRPEQGESRKQWAERAGRMAYNIR